MPRMPGCSTPARARNRAVSLYAGALMAAASSLSDAAVANAAIDHWLSYERPAEYEALVSEVRPVMSDGAELDCKMAIPAADGRPAPGKFPGVINNVNPYALLEVFFVNQIEELATLGFQGLTCRVRGSGDSDGEFAIIGSPEEWRDSYELVEWLAAQPGSNGRIAFEGASYGGMTALQAAIGKPPHLVTVVPLVPASDLYLDLIYRGGVKSRPYTRGKWALYTSLMNFPTMSPWRVWGHWYAHPDVDAFWQDTMPIHRVEGIDVPMLIAPGWADDVLPNGGVRLYEKMQGSGNAEQTWMFAGRWDHDMAAFPRNVVIAWLDYWLQERPDAPLPPARVVSYEMGSADTHRVFDRWPPAGTGTRSLALNPDGSLAESAGTPATVGFEQDAFSGLLGRPRTITFTSRTLDEDLVIAGDMALDLVASYDGPEATLHARVLEERNGDAILIKEGWLNVAHRDSHSVPAPIPRGQTVTATVDIGAMHRRVPSGSKLVLEVSGVDTWNWQTVSSRVTVSVATGKGGSRLRLQVLNPPLSPST